MIDNQDVGIPGCLICDHLRAEYDKLLKTKELETMPTSYCSICNCDQCTCSDITEYEHYRWETDDTDEL